MTARSSTARATPIRQSGVRAHNLAVLLQLVAASSTPPSRASAAAATGLTRATVSTLVDDLIAGGLLTELAPSPRTGAGRPAAGLALASDGPAGLGLEINVDYLAACVVNLTGEVRHRLVTHADQRLADPPATLAVLGELAAEARARAEADGVPLAGAALAVPGLVTPDGTVRVAPNLGWHDVAVPPLLRRQAALADLRITVDNEANLAALGELGAIRADTPPAGASSFVYISGEIGVGAGIVLDGTLYRGLRGWSGEIGHITVHPDGPVCRCGAPGCLERYAGQEWIMRAAGVGSVTALVDAAHRSEPAAVAALAAAGTALGIAAAAVVNLLDLDTVVLGGSYARLLPWLRVGMETELHRRVLTAGLAPVTLRAATLGADAAVRGAAGAVLRTVHSDPAAWLNRR